MANDDDNDKSENVNELIRNHKTSPVYLENGIKMRKSNVPPIEWTQKQSSDSPDRSATGLASRARRNRLQNQLDNPIPPQASVASRSTLLGRRIAQHQRKQYLLQMRGSNRAREDNRASRGTFSSSPKLRSQNRWHHDSPGSNERGLKSSDSIDSRGHDTAMDSINTYNTSYTGQDSEFGEDFAGGEYDYNDMQYDIADGTDDEATLTSVRQIMTIPQNTNSNPKNENALDSLDLTRTASSSSIEVDTRHAMYKQIPDSINDFPDQRMEDEDVQRYKQRYIDHNNLHSRSSESREKKERQRINKAKGDFSRFIPPLMNQEDLAYYRNSADTPEIKTAAFVVGAATVGAVLIGPVGLLVGAASAGIGVGIMQIPEEQRNHMKQKAVEALHKAQESALHCSEALSTACATSCNENGTSQFPAEMKQCFTQEDVGTIDDHQSITQSTVETSTKAKNSSFVAGTSGFSVDGNPTPAIQGRHRRVACLRDVRVIPVHQIHGLPVQKQPRAWLDILSSINTTPDEKSEAMEEIKILSRDKRQARILLDEGILDSLLYILNRYFDKTKRGIFVDHQERLRAKLAASCCITLGKAHCAAAHSNGDMLLMSMYDRGTVPEERQLAQMLYDIPYHVLTKEPNFFALQQASMSMAEELACSIKDLAIS